MADRTGAASPAKMNAGRTGGSLCAVCSDPVDDDEAHWAHQSDCPIPALRNAEHVPSATEVREAVDACQCDLVVHPSCCVDCAEEES